MQTNNGSAAVPQPCDLLSDILKVEIRHEEKISVADRTFCENQQRELYKTLDQLERWYKIFTTDTEQYRESHYISFKPNGEIIVRELSRPYEELPGDYERFAFKPFKSIDELAKLSFQAKQEFARRIVDYFNLTYNVSVPEPEIDSRTFPIDTRPVYTSYVDLVIDHLGGRSFRTTAEEEILSRFLELVTPARWATTKPELKGNKIVFPIIICFDEYYAQNFGRNQIQYNWEGRVNILCEGIVLGADSKLNGGQHSLSDFNPNDVDLKRWYCMATETPVELRFYKNGRIDARFTDNAAAAKCFRRLHLDEIILEQENK